MSFEDIDKLYGTSDNVKGYESLKQRYQGGEKSADLLWRLAKFCRDFANTNPDAKKQQEFIIEGQKYAIEAYGLDSNNYQAVKFAAILTGRLTDYLGTKEKIEQGYKFKEYLDKALSMDSKDNSLLHMRGRYAFSVAGLSWLERKAASVLYATPPTATYDEALADFLAAYEVQADWLENVFYIAKCYIQKGDKANAKKFLELASKITPSDDAEKAVSEEVKKLLPKY